MRSSYSSSCLRCVSSHSLTLPNPSSSTSLSTKASTTPAIPEQRISSNLSSSSSTNAHSLRHTQHRLHLFLFIAFSLCLSLCVSPVESSVTSQIHSPTSESIPAIVIPDSTSVKSFERLSPNHLVVPALVPEGIDTGATREQSLERLAAAPLAAPSAEATSIKPSATSKSGSRPTMSSSPSSSVSSTATSPVSATNTPLADPSADTALFGRPSVVGAFNLTSGILIYSAFMTIFIITIGAATIKRAQYRQRFRRAIEKHSGALETGRVAAGTGAAVGKRGTVREGKGGSGARSGPSTNNGASRGGGSSSGNRTMTSPREKDARDIDLSKQTSISRRALMEDVGPGGMQRQNSTRPHDAEPSRTGRQDRAHAGFIPGAGARPSENKNRSGGASNTGNGGRTGKPNHQRSASRGANNNYSRGGLDRTLSESAGRSRATRERRELEDADDDYYTGGYSSETGAPQIPQPTHQQARPLQPVRRADSNRMNVSNTSSAASTSTTRGPSPSARAAAAAAAGVERSGSSSRTRIATQGAVGRTGSNHSSRSASSAGSNVNSPIERNNSNGYGRYGGRGASPVAQIEMDNYPTPIARSNSTRLPKDRRGTPQPFSPSGLGHDQGY
ncbi:hypothetical protein BCR41DRAFT_363525 [Lobosporangium transversale]|uniref:Uncharacterized protein n=1 Tax=Lobosporangium transversale TaxID=64571 RepID=A0A1Y2G7S7_9FUNG|nr:hypothetical protein BCR41DRAFT_363525 [Lobosporangium transversale]ORZ01865.1 hypothetical protein BCR41DRAFT_363525 [Lobosporangium transversale]|eukprot:XP_021876162.1 hypothetical protein BCR41DRAFT_363525 [Lobosporangium transversale]